VALFDNAPHAWNAAFYSVPLHRGDQVLTGRAEYGSNVLAYWQAARRAGAEVVVVPNDEYGQLDVAALDRLAGERTALIGVSHVPTSGGLVQPAAEIGRVARACGALYLLDATQSIGQFPVDVDAIGCDMLTGTGRKFLRGPRGTGFLWVRTAALEKLDPFVAEIGSATWDGHSGFTWAPGARRFATWEHSYVNVLGLAAAVRQALDLGPEAIGQRAVALGGRLRGQLAIRARTPVTPAATAGERPSRESAEGSFGRSSDDHVSQHVADQIGGSARILPDLLYHSALPQNGVGEVAHWIASCCLTPGMRYEDLGADYYQRRGDNRRQTACHVGRPGALGFEVTRAASPSASPAATNHPWAWPAL